MTTAIIGQKSGSTVSGLYGIWMSEEATNVVDTTTQYFQVDSRFAGGRRHTIIHAPGLVGLGGGNINVSSAVLSIYKENGASTTIKAYQGLRTLDRAYTSWDSRASSLNWSTGGALDAVDVDTTAISTAVIATAFDYNSVTSLDAWAKDVAAGYAEPWLLLTLSNDTAYDGVSSQYRSQNNAGYEPYLTVVYTISTDPTVSSVSNASASEGSVVTHTVTLSGTPTWAVSYSASTANGTAISGVDYSGDLTSAICSNGVTYSAGKFNVPTGVPSFTVGIATTDNALDAADKTYTLTIGGTAGTGTIADNDAPPVVTFSDGVESFGVVTCVATLGAVSGKDVTFDVSTANGSKTAGTHYTAIVAQTVTIPAGSLTAAITVNTL